MRILLDFLPIALFVGAYKYYDTYVATAVLMTCTTIQMAIIYALDRKLTMMHRITLGLILAFGAATLLLHDENFIKWKPTVLYAAMAIGLAAALWVMKKNFLKVLLGSQLQLPDPVWQKLNIAWIVYCVFMSAVNAYVVMYYSTDAWFNFKLWGYAFPLVFLVAQGIYITPHLKADEPSQPS